MQAVYHCVVTKLLMVMVVVWLPLAGWVGSLVTNVHHQPGSRHPVAAE